MHWDSVTHACKKQSFMKALTGVLISAGYWLFTRRCWRVESLVRTSPPPGFSSSSYSISILYSGDFTGLEYMEPLFSHMAVLNFAYTGVLHENSDCQRLEFKVADGNFHKEKKPWKRELYYLDILLIPTKISPCYCLIWVFFPFYDLLEFCLTVRESIVTGSRNHRL